MLVAIGESMLPWEIWSVANLIKKKNMQSYG